MAEAAVVVPFRGKWNDLIPLLKALEGQTHRKELEIILSIDGLEAPPEAVAAMTDRVVNGPKAGPATARNRGWRSTAAPFILFTDGDCIPEPEWAERMLSGLRGEYQAVKGVYSHGGSGCIQRLAQVEFRERYRIMSRRDSIFLADTYSAGFRREWLERLGGFDESFPFPEHEDVDLSWRLVREGGKIGFMSDARVAHIHRERWADYFALKHRRGKWRMMVVREFPEMALSDGYTPQAMKLQMLLLPAVILSPFMIPFLSFFSAVPVVLFLLTCLPLESAALESDPGLIPLVPVFALWRSAALLSGAAAGIFERRRTCSRQ